MKNNFFEILTEALEEYFSKVKYKLLYKLKCSRIVSKKVLLPDVVPEGKAKQKKVFLSIAAIYFNEPDLIEWIEYHKIIGVERFYLYDNASTDNSRELLQPYIDDGTVVYHYAPGACMQMPVYNDAVYRYRNETQWLALIDLDEFLVPVSKDNVKPILKKYKKYPAVVVCWAVFDSNGHEKRPLDKLVIEAYTRVSKGYDDPSKDGCIKSIVNPKKVVKCEHPHFCQYIDDKTAVDTGLNLQNNPDRHLQKGIKLDVLQLNHYFTKSREDYIKKLARGRSDIGEKWDFDESCLNFSDTDNDYKILRFLPKLKKNMKKAEFKILSSKQAKKKLSD